MNEDGSILLSTAGAAMARALAGADERRAGDKAAERAQAAERDGDGEEAAFYRDKARRLYRAARSKEFSDD